MLSLSFFSATCIRRPGEANGSGWISTALTTLKMAVLAPMVRAMVSIVAAVKTGDSRSVRTAYRKSASSMDERRGWARMVTTAAQRAAVLFRVTPPLVVEM